MAPAVVDCDDCHQVPNPGALIVWEIIDEYGSWTSRLCRSCALVLADRGCMLERLARARIA